jgi:hypothetical protein
MNKPVVTTPTADKQIREIDDWWRNVCRWLNSAS